MILLFQCLHISQAFTLSGVQRFLECWVNNPNYVLMLFSIPITQIRICGELRFFSARGLVVKNTSYRERKAALSEVSYSIYY